jgi:hypothetical protein
MFKCFLIVGVGYISYGGFQTKCYKLVAVIVYARLKGKVGSLRKLSEWYTSEVLVYLFMLRRWAHNSTCTDAANPRNRADIDALVAGSADIDNDSST